MAVGASAPSGARECARCGVHSRSDSNVHSQAHKGNTEGLAATREEEIEEKIAGLQPRDPNLISCFRQMLLEFSVSIRKLLTLVWIERLRTFGHHVRCDHAIKL